MRVFFSYAREDESLAHLLAYVLEKTGKFTCCFDRDLRAGHNFDEGLRRMIGETDLVLVLLTKWSLGSPWVNQEIGFATALKKVVYPLAIQADIEPEGMIKMCHKCSLFDWTDSRRTIERLIQELRIEGRQGTSAGTYPRLDINLESTHARGEFLVERLGQLARDRSRRRIIRQSAAFSIFAVSNDAAYQKLGEHSPEYMKLLLNERRQTNRLVQARRSKYRLLLWPVRHYLREYQKMRFENLLQWLEEVRDITSIDIRCGQFQGPSNRLIVSDEFVLDGFKAIPSAGFGYSEARFQKEQIDQATKEFDATWSALQHDKTEAIRLLNAMYQRFVRGEEAVA